MNPERGDTGVGDPPPELLWLTTAILALVMCGGVLFLIMAPWVVPAPSLQVEVTETGAAHHLGVRPSVEADHAGPATGIALIRVDANVQRQQITAEDRGHATQPIDGRAVRNPDGQIVLTVDDDTRRRETFEVAWRGYSFRYALAPGTTAAFRWG